MFDIYIALVKWMIPTETLHVDAYWTYINLKTYPRGLTTNQDFQQGPNVSRSPNAGVMQTLANFKKNTHDLKLP